jgi:putative DNA primase/helicase
MIQTGYLKSFFNEDGEAVTFFKAQPALTYSSLRELFNNIEKDIQKIPEKKRVNLFYTVAHHLEGQRKFKSWQAQDIVPIDLDGIDLDRYHEYPPLVAKALDIDLKKCAVVYSGNGLHILIQVKLWRDKDYIKKAKRGYRQLLERIKAACDEKGLALNIDSTAWDYARILRVPFTVNEKTKDGKIITKYCKLLSNGLEEQPLEIPIIEAPAKRSLSVGQFPKPDKLAIMNNCEFMKWLKEKPEEVHEPHAYAMLSITGHFDDDNKTSSEYWHKFSSPSINSKNLAEFTEQALSASGPRTCEGINDLWGKCDTCPHYQAVTSPVMLKGEEHIGSEHLGFTLKGPKGGKIRQYDDLVKYFSREYNYKHIAESGEIYIYDKTYYRPYLPAEVKKFSNDHFSKPVKETERMEFLKAVEANDVTPLSFLSKPPEGMINLANGVLDINTGALKPHGPNFNFTYCLPYDFIPDATCPTWDKFLDEVTLGREDLKKILEEYLGYCIYGGEYIYHKALILSGGGKNGKSTFVDVLRKLVGEMNTSNVPLISINSNPFALAEMQRSLVNISEEEPPNCFKETGVFKNLTGNNTVMAQKKFKNPFKFLSKAKLVITYNEMPFISDTSTGMRRRLLVIPFDLDLEKNSDKVNTNIHNDLAGELSGIFNRALAGYRRLKEQGGFSPSISVEASVSEVIESSNSFYLWQAERLEKSEEDKRVRIADLYNDYRQYIDDSGERNFMGRRKFTQELKKFGIATGIAKMQGKASRVATNVMLSGIDNAPAMRF